MTSRPQPPYHLRVPGQPENGRSLLTFGRPPVKRRRYTPPMQASQPSEPRPIGVFCVLRFVRSLEHERRFSRDIVPDHRSSFPADPFHTLSSHWLKELNSESRTVGGRVRTYQRSTCVRSMDEEMDVAGMLGSGSHRFVRCVQFTNINTSHFRIEG